MGKTTDRKSTTDAIDMRHGRRGPSWTDVHDWVSFSDVSPAAKALYVIMRAHVNRARGDDTITTSLLTLARIMGYSRGDKISGARLTTTGAKLLPLDELVGLGAVDKVRSPEVAGRMVFVVHQSPPDGYRGPQRVEDWYAMNRPALDAARAHEKALRDARRAKARAAKNGTSQGQNPSSDGVTPNRGEQADGEGVTPNRGELSPPIGGNVSPPIGVGNLMGFEPDGNNHPPKPPSSASAPVVAEPATREEEAKKSEDQGKANAADVVLADILAAAGIAASSSRAPKGDKADKLTAEIARLLGLGWHPRRLVEQLGESLDGAQSVYGVLRYRIGDLPATPPAPPVTRPATPAPAPYQRPQPVESGAVVPVPDEQRLTREQAIAEYRRIGADKRARLAAEAEARRQNPTALLLSVPVDELLTMVGEKGDRA